MPDEPTPPAQEPQAQPTELIEPERPAQAEQPTPEESPKTPEPSEESEPVSETPTPAETPVVTQQDFDKQIEERLQQERNERRTLANRARAKKKSDNLDKLLQFAKQKKVITNADVRDLLHISQSTASNYLAELVRRGSIKREGRRGGTTYVN